MHACYFYRTRVNYLVASRINQCRDLEMFRFTQVFMSENITKIHTKHFGLKGMALTENS